MKKAKRIIIFVFVAFFIAGCAYWPAPDKAATQNMDPEKRKSIFSLPPSDTDVINEAWSYLLTEGKDPDYNKARARLIKIIEEYPHSRWFDSAQALIQTIDNLLDLQTAVQNQQQELNKAMAEKANLLKEKDTLKRDYNNLEEKYQTETTRLQQENEQLKRDISLLKRLEIQLDRREKMLK